MKKLNTTEFLIRAKKIHGSKYDYTKTVYVNKRLKITITCPLHGDFEILPQNHWEGCGCKKCGYLNRDNGNNTTTEFINKAKNIHGDKYDYSLVNYVNARTKVTIVCSEHGEFNQTPNNHVEGGQGCKECGFMYSSYKKNDWVLKGKNRIGIFYIIKCFNDNEEFYKFGITSTSIKRRYSHKKHMPYNFEIVKEVVSDDLSYIWDLEKRFKRIKINHRYVPLLKFNGSFTECFK